MRRKFALLVVCALALLGLAACNTKPEAVAIDPKKDICEICKMAIQNNQFATQIILANKKVLKFDDLGCMQKWMGENKDSEIAVSYVRDFDSKKWIDYNDATYVYNQSEKTPMSYGVISFDSKKIAETYAEKHTGSVVMSAKDLKKHDFKMMDMEHMSH